MDACKDLGHDFTEPNVSPDEEVKRRPKERSIWAFCKRCGAILECDLSWGARPKLIAPEVI